jgi:hypothetical protein
LKRFRRLLLLLLLALAAAGVAVYESWIRLPPNFLPWSPVMLDSKPSWFANIQLNALSTDGAACRAALGRSTMKFSILADRKFGEDCGFTDVVRADATPIPFSPRPVATCAVTAALYWWQQRLDEIAQAELKSHVTRIDQLGTYACRNINSAAEGRKSQHATANAIDIAAFHLADGRVVSVLNDYGKATPEGRFLDGAHDAACGLFNIVLGPKYNRLHANHFHLDFGGFRFCR